MMVTVEFLQDYSGALTDGKQFKKGQKAKFPPNVAEELIEAGRWAVEVKPKSKPKAKAKAKAEPKPKPKAKEE